MVDRSPLTKTTIDRVAFELLLLVIFNGVAYLVFAKVDALEWLYQFSLAHEEYELDEFLVLFFTLSISLGIFAIRRYKEGTYLLNHIHELAILDPLTGSYNRRYMDHALDYEVERSKRSAIPFSVLMIDADYFKRVNDEYGHHIGDKVLSQLSEITVQHTRSIDITARWGGEEFLTLCPNTSSEDAKTIGLKILHAIQSFDFDGIGKMTASIGVASYHNEETAINLLNRADACMYHAKEHGRNQVIVDTDLA